MADFNENININVRSDTKQAVRDINAFDEALKKMQSTMQKTEVSTRSINKWVKQLENVANPIEFANKQMDRLNKKLAKAQSGVEVKRITKDQVALMTATGQSENFQSARRQESGIVKAQQALEAFERSLDPTRQKLYELGQKLEENRQKFIELASAGQNTSMAEDAIRKIKAQMEDLQESTKKASNRFQVLWGRIKNIAIYRTIRRTMQTIVSLIKNGFSNVVKLSESAGNLQQQLTADYNLISTSLGTMLYTLLKPMMPTINSITDAFVGLVNIVNKFIAVLSGSDHYLKVVRKDIQDTRKEVGLLSFDKFESLSDKDKDEGVAGVDIEEVSLADNGLAKVMSKLGEIFESLGGIKALIVELLALGLLLKINKIATALGGMSTAMAGVTTAVLSFTAGFLIMDSLLKGLSDTGKIVMGTILTIVGGFVAIYTAIQLARNAWTGFGAIALATASAGVALAGMKAIITGAKNMSGYENGGIPDKSELFYMNERGVPEALVNTGGSQTNVINIDQLSEGMRRGFTQAIYETGLMDAMQTRLVLDGNSVNDNAFARAIFPALKTESRRRGGNQL